LADDERGRAELAEWERIDQLLAVAVPNAVYDPDADVAVQEELAAVEAELREAAPVAARADELQALRGLGSMEQTEPREGDEAVRDELTRRAGSYVQKDVDACLAHALAAHLGHYTDPAARAAAADLPVHPPKRGPCPASATGRRGASGAGRGPDGPPVPRRIVR